MDATLINLGEHVEWSDAQEEIKKTYIECGCTEEDVNACSSKGLFPMLEAMLDENENKFGVDKAEDIQTSVYDILSGYEERGSTECTLMPGCIDTLEWLTDQGFPLGICTSNSLDAALKALRKKGIEHYFKVVIGRSAAYRMKPSPDQLIACLKALNADPKNSIMVGDSHKDVLAGKALGCYTVAIPVHFTRLKQLNEAKPDKILKSLAELPKLIMELCEWDFAK
jgi:HAD superfamily hydrolase (TIGR01549 family)